MRIIHADYIKAVDRARGCRDFCSVDVTTECRNSFTFRFHALPLINTNSADDNSAQIESLVSLAFLASFVCYSARNVNSQDQEYQTLTF